MKRSHAQPGFTLIGILLVILLCGVFLLLASELFTGTARISQQAAALEEGSGQIDSALHGLRAAVWSARTIDVVDEHTVQVDDVLWQWSEVDGDTGRPPIAGRLHAGRDDAGSPLPVTFHFASHPAGLQVTIEDQPTVLPSQIVLARGGRP